MTDTARALDAKTVERISVNVSDKVILRMDIEENDPRLSMIIDELREDLHAFFANQTTQIAELREALQAARKMCVSAIGSNVIGIDFNPADHPVIKKVDAALTRTAAGIENDSTTIT